MTDQSAADTPPARYCPSCLNAYENQAADRIADAPRAWGIQIPSGRVVVWYDKLHAIHVARKFDREIYPIALVTLTEKEASQ